MGFSCVPFSDASTGEPSAIASGWKLAGGGDAFLTLVAAAPSKLTFCPGYISKFARKDHPKTD